MLQAWPGFTYMVGVLCIIGTGRSQPPPLVTVFPGALD
jgi:hypothetical protein